MRVAVTVEDSQSFPWKRATMAARDDTMPQQQVCNCCPWMCSSLPRMPCYLDYGPERLVNFSWLSSILAENMKLRLNMKITVIWTSCLHKFWKQDIIYIWCLHVIAATNSNFRIMPMGLVSPLRMSYWRKPSISNYSMVTELMKIRATIFLSAVIETRAWRCSSPYIIYCIHLILLFLYK